MQDILTITNLRKKYSPKADWAVDGISFSVGEGEILGLLGHNGAGKSTTLKCLEGMLPFEEGSISICGYDIIKQPIEAKSNMGFVTDNHAVFSRMTGIQYLTFMSDIYKVPSEKRQQRVDDLQKVFNLGDSIYNLISSYSHGMKQKICMMGSLMHEPKLWVLDEPMTGLDAVTMKSVEEFMKEYAAKGNAIIFSSHNLDAVAQLCDRVIIIKQGSQICDVDTRRDKKKGVKLEEMFFDACKR